MSSNCESPKNIEKLKDRFQECLESFEHKITELNKKQSEYFKDIRMKIEESKKKIVELKERFNNKIKSFGEFETLNDEKLEEVSLLMKNLKLPNIDIEIKLSEKNNDKNNADEDYVFILDGQHLLQIYTDYDAISVHDLNIRNIHLNRFDSSIVFNGKSLYIHTGSCPISYLYEVNPLSLSIISYKETLRSGFSMIYYNNEIINFQINSEKCIVIFYDKSNLRELNQVTLDINQVKSVVLFENNIFLVNSWNIWELLLDESNYRLEIKKHIELRYQIIMAIGLDKIYLIAKNYNRRPKQKKYLLICAKINN